VHGDRFQAKATSLDYGTAYGVVTQLTKSLQGRHHNITMDNFFTSPRLFKEIYRLEFYYLGTARQNQKGFPTSLNFGQKQKQERGTLHI
jgi:hypothetical protein